MVRREEASDSCTELEASTFTQFAAQLANRKISYRAEGSTVRKDSPPPVGRSGRITTSLVGILAPTAAFSGMLACRSPKLSLTRIQILPDHNRRSLVHLMLALEKPMVRASQRNLELPNRNEEVIRVPESVRTGHPAQV